MEEKQFTPQSKILSVITAFGGILRHFRPLMLTLHITCTSSLPIFNISLTMQMSLSVNAELNRSILVKSDLLGKKPEIAHLSSKELFMNHDVVFKAQDGTDQMQMVLMLVFGVESPLQVEI